MTKILFQGDSVTDAFRIRDHDEHMGDGYATIVASELGYINPGRYEFVNRGVSGNRVIDIYARIKSDIINIKPDVLSILVGVNDVWHEFESQNGIACEKYERIFNMIVEEIKEALPNTKIIILEPFVLKGYATIENWNEFSEEVYKRAASSKKVADKYGLTFVELQKTFIKAEQNAPAQHWLLDGVHPTAAGHGLIAHAWIEAFEKIKI